MDISKPLKFSEIFNSFENSRDSVLPSGSEDFIISIGPHGSFLDYGSSAECYCDQCSGCRIPLYTCKGESCRVKCPPHTRKCSECAGHNYSARHITNQKYYDSRKSRINSERSISFEKSLINKSSDSVVDKDLSEIWNNTWSEALEHFP
ncbi:6819_t:CDS:1 [Dentiscutata erythropus]|uniref:6819_t:CDS:1 n=1 Tax=Dentiscutata erythropus TaxID=1348616 RepID=A0A9N8Z1S0_9GLOM|nr:6819_t:CDS:1 [Dentiscutata erythropus]